MADDENLVIEDDSKDIKKKTLNLRHCEIVIYKEYLKVDIQKTCKNYATIKHWAYILHDKDDTGPHYHIYIHFGDSSVPIERIAKWFHLEFIDEKGNEQSGINFIRRVKGRRSDMLLYLIHGNDSARHKHQYAPSEVTANFNFKSEIENAKIIGNFEKYSYREQVEYCNMLPVSEKGKVYNQLKKLHELHQAVLASRTDRNIEVVFITGGTGTAKTSYAKLMLRKLKYDFSVSSSSNDPFQDYMGERAMILDDLRDKSFSYDDFLKLIDNNTRSSIKSRFSNKVFEGKMIVITSAVPITYWYKEYRINSYYDKLDQIYRRITTYIEMTKDCIRIYDGLTSEGKPRDCLKILENVFIQKINQRQKAKSDIVRILDDVNFDLLNGEIEDKPEESSGEATQEEIPGINKPKKEEDK